MYKLAHLSRIRRLYGRKSLAERERETERKIAEIERKRRVESKESRLRQAEREERVKREREKLAKSARRKERLANIRRRFFRR